ncbi:GntR family transcriptional regulator [Halalkalibacter oceani]|uniref:GntR family transcriptional regulator n=1 Tax=Halalkalibacter oceani TaxID=1653776 RepID=A0A9X2IPY5_9BACI|nr:GntR family transcriptional regulator [Halalkalibacter oceani]
MGPRILLKDVAYKKIIEMILQGDYFTDNHTSENQLVELLQMSRTPIREALQRLQHDGIVKIIPNQGIAIQELSLKELNNMFDMRLAIETFSLRQIFRSITDQQIHYLERNVEQQREGFLKDQDFVKFLMLDGEFHEHLIKINDNKLFIDTMSYIRTRFFFDISRQKYPETTQKRIEEHARIVEAIKARDEELAIKELKTHLINAKANI